VVDVVEVRDVGVDPASNLVVETSVDVDADAVVEKVAAGAETQRQRVELIQARSAGRVHLRQIPPFAHSAANITCSYRPVAFSTRPAVSDEKKTHLFCNRQTSKL